LQIAHPLVAAGVAEHSDFRRDPFARLRVTLETMLQITFGDRAQAQAAAGRANAVHDRVHGRLRERAGSLPRGAPYRATDPELALWVHATLVFAALDGYAWFVGPLSERERSRYYEETKAEAALFGVARSYLPESYADFKTYLLQMMDGSLLTGRGDAGSLARSIFEPRAPFPLRAVARCMKTASTPFLPERLRQEFDLPWGLRERAEFRSAAAALRAAMPLMPPHIRFWPHYDMALRRMAVPAGRPVR